MKKLIVRLPRYQYCGPGTKLSKRLERGDKGVNVLDKYCKRHDIIYSKLNDTEPRSRADSELAKATAQRVTAKDSSIGEKTAALSVAGIMTGRRKLGMGLK